MTMNPLYPCGKPCSKADTILCNHKWNYDGIAALNLESRGNVISSFMEWKILTTFAVTIVIYKSRNLIGTISKHQSNTLIVVA